MAVGNAATVGANLQISSGLPAAAGPVFSATGWCVTRATTGDPSIFAFESGTASASKGCYLEWVTGVLTCTTDAGVTNMGSSPALNKPFFWFYTLAGSGANQAIAGWCYPGDQTLVTVSRTGTTFTAGALTLLTDSFADKLDGCVEEVTIWDGVVLSTDDLLRVMRAGRQGHKTYQSLKPYLHTPLFSLDGVRDDYGNNRAWTINGTLRSEPPLPLPALGRGPDLPVFKIVAGGGSTVQGDPSAAFTVAGAATSAALKASAAAVDFIASCAATSAALKASAPAVDFVVAGAATSAALKASAPSATMDFVADATGQAVKQGAPSATMTVSCAATGQSVRQAAPSATMTVAVGARSNVQHTSFPLTVETNGRYVKDASGNPWRLKIDSGWEVCTMPVLADWQQYLDDRLSRGFDSIIIQMTDSLPGSGRPNPASNGAGGALPFLKNTSGTTWDGDPGFTNHDADWSSPNETYWDWIETVVSQACSRGMALLANPCYLGVNFGTEGWYQTLINSANTQTVCYNFGVYLGNKFKNYHNLIWVMGGDMTPTAASEGETRLHKILEGIQSTGDTGLVTAHWQPNSIATDVSAFLADMDLCAVYYYGTTASTSPKYPKSRTAYGAASPLPTFLFESTYEGEHSVTNTKVREFAWTSYLSGIAGLMFGNNPVWIFDTGWQAALSSTGAQMMNRLHTYVDTISDWYNLVPHGLGGIGTLVTAGGGTSGNDDYVTAAATPAGTWLVAYVPNSHSGSVTIDMSKLTGSVLAKWFDPTNGTYSTIGTYSNTGTQAFTTTGNNSAGAGDWVLQLQAQTSGAPAVDMTVAGAATSAALKQSAPSATMGFTVGATGAALYAAAPSSAMDFNAAATSAALKAAAPSTALDFNVNARAPGGVNSNFFLVNSNG